MGCPSSTPSTLPCRRTSAKEPRPSLLRPSAPTSASSCRTPPLRSPPSPRPSRRSPPPAPPHLSSVICHLSSVTAYHLSSVICHVSSVTAALDLSHHNLY